MRLVQVFAVLALCVVAACGAGPDDRLVVSQKDMTELESGLLALSPEVDPEEAERAARIAYEYARQLAIEYNVTDPPLVHNTKVNLGLRPRGLCYHWADDMEARFREEGFQTFDLHRAIANSDNPFRIEHSTVILSSKGAGTMDGMIIDPWRYGGELHWSLVEEDPDYNWIPRRDVFEAKRTRAEREARFSG